MASHQPQPAGFTLSTEDEEQNSKESSARTSYDWDLLYDSQRYTSEERELVQVSETEISRVCVYNMNGRKCTVAGYNRTKGDFTLPSNLLVVDLMDKDKHWIREPDPFDDPIDLMTRKSKYATTKSNHEDHISPKFNFFSIYNKQFQDLFFSN